MSMKILFVDSRVDGHHYSYISSLISMSADRGYQSYLFIPKTSLNFPYVEEVFYEKGFKDGEFNYRQWIKSLKYVVNKIKPDIIHILTGDDLYRYFSFGISRLKRSCKVLITIHQVRRSILHDCSLKCLAKGSDTIVVHTMKLKNDLLNMGIQNVKHIEYPQFSIEKKISKDKAFEIIGENRPKPKVLLALGGTREDKGLDILLSAMDNVSIPFHLIIAGQEEYFTREYIERRIEKYKDNTTIILEFLSQDMFDACICASDIIVLPYKRVFDGASGPLGEGVARDKMIVGSNHGSLGQIIEKNHLGFTFETEDVDALTKVLEKALSCDWKSDDKYKQYKEFISPKRFQQNYYELYKGWCKK